MKIGYKGYTIKIQYDEDCESPREYDCFGHMICFHNRHNLGDKHDYKEPLDLINEIASGAIFGGMGTLEMALDTLWDETAVALGQCFEKHQIDFAEASRRLIDGLVEKSGAIILPLYVYEHGGITMSTGRFACDSGGWDTSFVGYIYATKQEALDNWGVKRMSAKVQSTTLNASGVEITKKVTIAEAAENLLRAEVAVYAQYLEGDVYGYIIEDEAGNEVDSLWGLYGSDYCLQEAKNVVDGKLEE